MTATRNRRPEAVWWRRPWVVPLGLGAAIFLAFSLPPYLSFDPGRSRVAIPADFAALYWLLNAHIMFGAVAMVTCCLQVWPWLRQHHPKIHRTSGRLYVWAGVLPAGLLAFPVSLSGLSGPVAQTSTLLLTALWLGTTAAGYLAARQRRFRDHRRWMICSFALTTSIAVSRIWLLVFDAALSPTQATVFGGNEVLFEQAVAGASAWTSWVVNLALAQWWLDRRPRRGRAVPVRREAAATRGEPVAAGAAEPG